LDPTFKPLDRTGVLIQSTQPSAFRMPQIFAGNEITAKLINGGSAEEGAVDVSNGKVYFSTTSPEQALKLKAVERLFV
jgi:hypothetical protein